MPNEQILVVLDMFFVNTGILIRLIAGYDVLYTKENIMYLITGANGQLGTLIIKELLKTTPASQIIAAVRNPDKANELRDLGIEIRLADYKKAGDWDKALRGVTKLLLISSSDFDQRTLQHKNVIDAAKKNSTVKLIGYTSILRADTSKSLIAQDHIATEKLIDDSGIPAVFFRNGWYLENYAGSVLGALEQGAIYGAADSGKVSAASRSDYAAAIAKVLSEEKPVKKIYELAGDTAFTLSDLATELSVISKKDIKYINLPVAEYTAALMQIGLPEPVSVVLADADRGLANGDLFNDNKEISQLIQRKTLSMADFLKNLMT
jgi:NAD(P)H dehydrogenase (quinone)